MPKPHPDLFQIGEVSKLMGVSRRMILNYEELGLLTPAYQDESSGYRYYTADNLTQIRSIRGLQSLGLSLSEVREYYYDMTNIEANIKRLTDLRDTLDRNIQLLQLRAADRGDMTVRWVTLRPQLCFCRRYICADTAEAANRLRDTYIAAARTGFMFTQERMFTVRTGSAQTPLDLLCCIPMREGYDGPERMDFPETRAVCIYYRGAYEGIANAIKALTQYVEENRLKTTGCFLSIYLEGPPNRGANSADYITQVAVPVEDSRGSGV